MRRRQRGARPLLWKVPDVCAGCGAAIDPAEAGAEPDPHCRFCRAPLAREAILPTAPVYMQALVDRTGEIVESLQTLVTEAAGDDAGAAALARRGLFGMRMPATPVEPAAPADLGPVPGAQWLCVGDRWWQWSWFDRQWQPADRPIGAPPVHADGWVHWVQGLDGAWTVGESGTDGSPWPAPASPA